MNFEHNENILSIKDLILNNGNLNLYENSILNTSISKLKLYKHFEEIVGDYIFNKCFLSYENDKLKIVTEHTAIKTELLLRKDLILKQLNEHCGEHFLKSIDIY